MGLWSKILIKEKNFCFGVSYFPCENSKYWDGDLFSELSDDIANMKVGGNEIFIMGDFNARTDHLTDHVNLEESATNVPMRLNRDDKINTNGRSLTDLCKSTDLCILNGRLGNDAKLGDFTCYTYNGHSTVDYMIAESSMIYKIRNFTVLQFDPSLSDVHFAIKCENYERMEQAVQQPDKKCVRKYWNSDIGSKFYNSLLDQTLVKVWQLLKSDGDDEPKFNTFDSEFRRLIINGAKEAGAFSFGTRRSRKNAWFDKECQYMKRKYKRICRVSGKDNQMTKRIALKEYKKFFIKKKSSFLADFNEKIVRMRTASPREYWSLLASLKSKKKDPNVELKELHEQFQQLNTRPCYYDADENFSFEEVLQSIHKLANNKSAGQDDIFPEFMKNLPIVFVHLMKDFINKILNTGTVTDEWAVSIICPIHKKGDTSDPNNYRGVSLINCICKIFTSLIETRIRNHLDATGTIGNEQAGFRKGISGQDQIFLLSKIVDFYLDKRKRLYATFID